MSNDNAVILFTRIPVPGKTKTRLQPFLTGEQCSLLQRAFLLDISKTLRDAEVCCDIVVCYAPDGNLEELRALLPEVCDFLPQRGQSLGDKMHDAICRTLGMGYGRCLLIGSDVPLLRANVIDEAFCLLESRDIVLCPTDDGGYYLIGMKEPCKNVFNLDEYGISTVFEKTMAAAVLSGKTCAKGSSALDVDEPGDLFLLAEKLARERPEVCAETRKVLSRFRITR